MKKTLKTIQILIFLALPYFCFAQKEFKEDSIKIFIRDYNYLDSIFRKKIKISLSYLQILEVVKSKLKAGHYIPHDVNRNLIDWITYKEKSMPDGYIDTTSIFIAEKLVNCANNNFARVELLKLKFYYFDHDQRLIDKYLTMYNKLLTDLIELEEDERYRMDSESIVHSNLLANRFENINNLEMAEKYYLKVLSYPFYKVPIKYFEYGYKRTNFTEYIKAGKRILEIRRGNLEKLEYTFFVTAAMDVLGPIKKQYIEELGGKYIEE
jgi:hypothetical protein